MLGIEVFNPLNLKQNPANKWVGKVVPSRHRTLEEFEDMPKGLRAGAMLLQNYWDKKGVRTIRDAISLWAPASADGNNTANYIKFVASEMKVGPDTPISIHKYRYARPMIEAMATFEQGHEAAARITPAQYDAGLAQAGIVPPPKALTSTRTVRGGTIAIVGTLLGAADEVREKATEILQPMIGYSGAVKYVLLGITLLGIAGMLWARIDDRRRLAR